MKRRKKYNAHERRDMRVEVFRNLHQEGVVWSVRVEVDPGRWLTLAHSENVLVKDAEFVVQPAGHQKVIDTQAKDIHAFVRGTLVVDPVEARRHLHRFARQKPVQVYYNPYRVDKFVDLDGFTSLGTAELVSLSEAMGRPHVEAFGVSYTNHDATAFTRKAAA
jgi:hypothetical protein